MARIPKLEEFTDAELAKGLRRLPLSRLRNVITLLWAKLSADARQTLIMAIATAPDVAGEMAGNVANETMKAFLRNLLAGGKGGEG